MEKLNISKIRYTVPNSNSDDIIAYYEDLEFSRFCGDGKIAFDTKNIVIIMQRIGIDIAYDNTTDAYIGQIVATALSETLSNLMQENVVKLTDELFFSFLVKILNCYTISKKLPMVEIADIIQKAKITKPELDTDNPLLTATNISHIPYVIKYITEKLFSSINGETITCNVDEDTSIGYSLNIENLEDEDESNIRFIHIIYNPDSTDFYNMFKDLSKEINLPITGTIIQQLLFKSILAHTVLLIEKLRTPTETGIVITKSTQSEIVSEINFLLNKYCTDRGLNIISTDNNNISRYTTTKEKGN